MSAKRPTNCEELKSIENLKGLTGLETLDLRNCRGLSSESLAAIKAALPSTKIRLPNESP